jgi:hypothetical protein
MAGTWARLTGYALSLGLTLGGRQSNDSLSLSIDHPDHFYRELSTLAGVVPLSRNLGYRFARVGRRDGR